MPGLRKETAVHTEHGTAGSTLGVLSRTGGNAGQAEQRAGNDADPKTDGRASLGDAQTMDGRNTLPDAKAQRGQRRDESECTRLQPEKGHENHRHYWLDESVNGVKTGLFTPSK